MTNPGDHEQGFGQGQDHDMVGAGVGPVPPIDAPEPAPPHLDPAHLAYADGTDDHVGYAAGGATPAVGAGWQDDPIAPELRSWTPASPAPAPHAADRLDLSEGDRLPWLESADEGEDYEQIDGRRVTGVVIAGLIALAAVVGAVWWGTHHQSGNAPVADGSTVAAPATPYKVAPAAPGGKTFAGTDDTSFAVSQGKPVQEHLAGGAAAPGDAAVSKLPGEAASTAAKAPVAAASAADAAWGGGIVQIGAFNSEARAATAWDALSRGHDALTGAHHRIVSAVVDGGTVWRLQVLTAAGGGAAMCDRLKAAGVACQVKH